MLSQIFLKKIELELSKRKIANPQYSLRAFARDLGVSVSILSRVRNNTLPMSNNLKQKLKSKLFKTDSEFYSFLSEYLNTSEQTTQTKTSNSSDYIYFRYWYFWTILQTKTTKNPQEISSHMARLLSISEMDALSIIDYFSKISESYKTKVADCFNFAHFFKKIHPSTFDERYLQLINNLPKCSIDNDVSLYISQKAFPIAINQNLADKIQEKITRLSHEIVQMIEDDHSPKDHVCELVVSLIPSSQLPFVEHSSLATIANN